MKQAFILFIQYKGNFSSVALVFFFVYERSYFALKTLFFIFFSLEK